MVEGETRLESSGTRPAAEEVVRALRARLEADGRRRARRAGWVRRFIPTGLTPLDELLPHGGVPCGAVTEILGDGLGVGCLSLAMRIAARCIGPCPETNVLSKTGEESDGGEGERRSDEATKPRREKGTEARSDGGGEPNDLRRIVVIDTFKDFYPPAVWVCGLAPARMVVVRPVGEKDALWAVEQALGCAAVAVVVASLSRMERRFSRRLQLAAQRSGAVGVILRPARATGKSFAAVQLRMECAGGREANRHDGSPRFPMHVEGESASGRALHRQSSISNRQSRCVAVSNTDIRATPDAHLCRITLLKVREGMPAEPVLVDLHHEAGTGPLSSLPVDRSAAKRA